MPATPQAFERLAALFRYPGGDYGARVLSCIAALEDARCKEARARMAAFAEQLHALRQEEIEELFTRTFDLNPRCALDLGWHLYGETYGRGRFLVRVRGLLREHGIAESGELPDHLSHVLVLLGRAGRERASELAGRAVTPALAAMSAALQGTGNPYRHLLSAARALVEGSLIETARGAHHE